ncbi:MAG: hypothetical protein EZS28_033134 [Streblomastix strix]|uniref:DM10 domain-containing protein n=1 Tax=Streblomastix strix TaxID=222440 RepID=A0A5J4ULR5_9EUKA|nr:MAG: hypothetical protein EZS28_033134 [Streblomastix strix]
MDVQIYEIAYHIVDCDEFTKNFFNRVENQLNRKDEFPYDPFIVNLEKMKPHPRTTTTQDPEKLALRIFSRTDRIGVVFRNNAYLFLCARLDDKHVFTLKSFPLDDTPSNSGPLNRNSGIVKSKFLNSVRVKLDDGDLESYLKKKDFHQQD